MDDALLRKAAVSEANKLIDVDTVDDLIAAALKIYAFLKGD